MTPHHTTNNPVFMFDLGGVLVEIQSLDKIADWALEIMTKQDFEHLWTQSPRPAQLERGLLTPREFATLVQHEYRLKIDVDGLLEHFRSIVMDPFPGAVDVLKRANNLGRTVCLSNTNRLHWDKVTGESDLLEHFDLLLPSFELGHVKPQREIYEEALRRIHATPEDVVFFDDREENVLAARNLGIHAHRVYGPEAVLTHLRGTGGE